MDKETLARAVKDGVVTSQQAEQLLQRSQSGKGRSEPLRFVRGFGDIFVALGVILVVLAGHAMAKTPLILGLCMAGCVVASEWLVARKRLVLPGMALLLGLLSYIDEWLVVPEGGLIWLICAAVAGLYYWRYRLPFAVLVILLCVALAVYHQLVAIGVSRNGYLGATIAMGILVFALAMWFDRQDTARISRLSDTAFWLHLAAAPMITHGVMISYIVNTQSFGGIVPVAFYAIFFLVALFVDRRALVLSGVAYMVGTLVINAIGHQMMSFDHMIWLVMGLGVVAVLVGVYWYPLRRVLFGWSRHSQVARQVPPFD